MHMTYDPEADAVYIYLRDVPLAATYDIDHARIIDFSPPTRDRVAER